MTSTSTSFYWHEQVPASLVVEKRRAADARKWRVLKWIIWGGLWIGFPFDVYFPLLLSVLFLYARIIFALCPLRRARARERDPLATMTSERVLRLGAGTAGHLDTLLVLAQLGRLDWRGGRVTVDAPPRFKEASGEKGAISHQPAASSRRPTGHKLESHLLASPSCPQPRPTPAHTHPPHHPWAISAPSVPSHTHARRVA